MKIARREVLKTVVAASLSGSASSLWANERPRFSLSVRRLALKHTWTIAEFQRLQGQRVRADRAGRRGRLGRGGTQRAVWRIGAEKTLAALEQARPLFESGDWFEYVDLRQAMGDRHKDQPCARCSRWTWRPRLGRQEARCAACTVSWAWTLASRRSRRSR